MGLTWGIVTFVFYLRIYFCCHFVFFICFKDFHNERGVSLWSPFCSDLGISICFIFPYLCWGISFFPFYMGSGDWTQSSGFPDFVCWTVFLELNFSLWQLFLLLYPTPPGGYISNNRTVLDVLETCCWMGRRLKEVGIVECLWIPFLAHFLGYPCQEWDPQCGSCNFMYMGVTSVHA